MSFKLPRKKWTYHNLLGRCYFSTQAAGTNCRRRFQHPTVTNPDWDQCSYADGAPATFWDRTLPTIFRPKGLRKRLNVKDGQPSRKTAPGNPKSRSESRYLPKRSFRLRLVSALADGNQRKLGDGQDLIIFWKILKYSKMGRLTTHTGKLLHDPALWSLVRHSYSNTNSRFI